MKTRIKLLIAFLPLTALLAQAQKHQPPDPAQRAQHRVGFLTEKLGLSPEQQEAATSIFTNEITMRTSLRGQMKTAHESLQTAVKNNDSAGIDQAAGIMGNLIAQMISAQAKAESAFVQTLNPDQQSTYAQMRGHRPGMHGFGGPGGLAGPRPF